jgi:hypothetical protein
MMQEVYTVQAVKPQGTLQQLRESITSRNQINRHSYRTMDEQYCGSSTYTDRISTNTGKQCTMQDLLS